MKRINTTMQEFLKEAKRDIEKEHGGGDCFSAAFDFMIDNRGRIENLKLAHGFVSGQGKLSGYMYAHAWCEDDNTVYDYSNNRELKIPKIVYYSIGNIEPDVCKYYSENDMHSMAVKYRHKGPWEIENKFFKQMFFRRKK